MSITDELRRKMDTLGWYDEDGNIVYTTSDNPVSEIACLVINSKTFGELCDRIDAVHEKAMSRAGQLLADVEKDRDYNYAYWQDCKQKVLQGNITFNELNAKIERLEDELSHCIELPKDADGEPIHVGDELEEIEYPFYHGKVNHIELDADGWWAYVDGTGRRASRYRHYHAPTVKDLLQEILFKAHIYDEQEMEMLPDLIAEYAPKLRLADGAE